MRARVCDDLHIEINPRSTEPPGYHGYQSEADGYKDFFHCLRETETREIFPKTLQSSCAKKKEA